MSESAYQSKVIKQLRKEGWFCLRLMQTTTNGVADWLIMHPHRTHYFLEFKAKGEKPDPLQVYRHKEMLLKTGLDTKTMTEP